MVLNRKPPNILRNKMHDQGMQTRPVTSTSLRHIFLFDAPLLSTLHGRKSEETVCSHCTTWDVVVSHGPPNGHGFGT